MMFATNLIVAIVIMSSIVSTSSEHIKMESMIFRHDFVKQSRSSPDKIHEVVFSINQNFDLIESELLERSDPNSDKYQQWLTFDEVGELTSNIEGAMELLSWLEANGVTPSWISEHDDYIKASAPISVWETLLNTEFYEWEDQDSDLKATRTYTRSEHYSLPAELTPHISAVFNTCQAFPKIRKHAQYKSSETRPLDFRTTVDIRRLQANLNKVIEDEEATATTVEFLSEYYNIPVERGSEHVNQSVFEMSTQYFSQDDLQTFQIYYNLTQQSAIDKNGHETSDCSPYNEGVDCFIGNLDIQYITGMAQHTTSIYWYVSGDGDDPFVSWITDVANEKNPPKSNSISFGTVEQMTSKSVLHQFKVEAAKLGSMGVTVIASSGDDGVANFGCRCAINYPTSPYNCACDADSSSITSSWEGENVWSGTGYFPSFPASCPYVTSVGATMGPTIGLPEQACQSEAGGVITSGGGFSTYYARPSWQDDAIENYFSQLNTLQYPLSGFNSKGRGYPDISLIATKYQVVVNDYIYGIYGTSAVAPVVAAMVSLVNAERLKENKTSVGFINPSLYHNETAARAYNDMKIGFNKCCSNNGNDITKTECCNSGFASINGWDPVTGWGSVNFPGFSEALSYASEDSSSKKSSSKHLNSALVAATVIVVVFSALAVFSAIYFRSEQKKLGTDIRKVEMREAILPSASTQNPIAAPSASTVEI